jgi:hypothetical protein
LHWFPWGSICSPRREYNFQKGVILWNFCRKGWKLWQNSALFASIDGWMRSWICLRATNSRQFKFNYYWNWSTGCSVIMLLVEFVDFYFTSGARGALCLESFNREERHLNVTEFARCKHVYRTQQVSCLPRAGRRLG